MLRGVASTPGGPGAGVTSLNGLSGVLNLISSDSSITITPSGVTIDLKANGTPGSGTVTSVSVVSANGVSASVANPTSTPALTFTLGNITPASIVSPGAISGTTINGTLFQLGTLTYTATNLLESLQSSVNNFNQLIIQNSNNGASASSDIVVNNDQSTNTTFYGDFGMNSSGFTGSGAFNAPNNVFLTSTSSDLAIGTTTSNAIHFVVNNGATDAMTIAANGNVSILTNLAVTGTISASNFSGSSSGTNTGDQTNITGTAANITATSNSTLTSLPNLAVAASNLTTNTKTRSVGITIDGGGSVITTGNKGYIYVPYACTITANTLIADQSGSVVIDVWRATYPTVPTVANTITASALPTLSSQQVNQDTTLTGWTTSVAAGSFIGFNVNSAATVTRVNLTLTVTTT